MCPSQLIPLPRFSYGFTTCSTLQLDNLHHVHLDDKELGVHKVTSRTTHRVVAPPSLLSLASLDFPPPSEAWEAVYPKGSINPSARIPGGFGFYLSGPAEFSQKLKDATHAVFSYRMMLDPGWEWVKGGKLPGICKGLFYFVSRLSATVVHVDGGVGDLAYGCTGGRKEQRCSCFNLRPMWRYFRSLHVCRCMTSHHASADPNLPANYTPTYP